MRRLSAIMFTDMVGYSALSQKDEALALALLAEHRALLRPLFTKHDGREIDTAGDSFFVEFPSAVEAAHCAVEIQTTLYERNKVESAERRILIRVGLHIGDVVFEGNNVHGDGVNIAARLEPLARPGGICISEDVARQIRNKVPFPVVKMGPEKLKNITMPVEIYCIVLPWQKDEPRKRKTAVSPKVGWALLGILLIIAVVFLGKANLGEEASSYSRFRLAVLPLANISNNPQDDYFADGMTEELISNLSKIGGLNVIARTSTMKYKEADKDISQIGEELMVGSILEGSVRKFENKARITIQLVDVATQQPVWSKDYDRELRDIFTVQSEIAQSVAHELKVRLVPSEKEQLQKTATTNMPAFQEYLIGKYLLNKRTPESIQTSIRHFEKATRLDTAFALPYAQLAYAYTLVSAAGYGNLPRTETENKARQAVQRALQLDPTLAEAHAASGYIKFRIDWDWAGADRQFRRAIELAPGYATAYEWYGLSHSVHVRLDEALEAFEKAVALDPLSPSVNNGLARVYHFRNEFDKALAQINKTKELDANYAEVHLTEAILYFKTRQYDKAEAAALKAVELSGRRPVTMGFLGGTYAKRGKMAEAQKLLAQLEAPPLTNDKLYAITFIKRALGQSEESIRILEQLYEDKYGVLIFLKVERELFETGNHPRHLRLIEKMGL